MDAMNNLCMDFVLPELQNREPLFGDWRVDSFLGAGGFACVFSLVHGSRPELPPAVIKAIPVTKEIINRYGGRTTVTKAVFAAGQEIMRLIELAHMPHIVSMHNFQILRRLGPQQDAAMLLLMMDYYPRSLGAILRRAIPTPERVVHILSDCLQGLEAVHAHNVVHRDIKPANIFLDDQDNASIGDFGIALSLRESFGAAHKAGTLSYMPPEACDTPGCMDNPEAGDLYALAMSGFRALEGALPFQHECTSRDVMLKRRVGGEPIAFSRPVPEPLEDVLLTALAHNPADRFATAGAFRRALLDAGVAMSGCRIDLAPPPAAAGSEPYCDSLEPTVLLPSNGKETRS